MIPNQQVRGDGGGRLAGEDAESGEEVKADCLSREFGASRTRSLGEALVVAEDQEARVFGVRRRRGL